MKVIPVDLWLLLTGCGGHQHRRDLHHHQRGRLCHRLCVCQAAGLQPTQRPGVPGGHSHLQGLGQPESWTGRTEPARQVLQALHRYQRVKGSKIFTSNSNNIISKIIIMVVVITAQCNIINMMNTISVIFETLKLQSLLVSLWFPCRETAVVSPSHLCNYVAKCKTLMVSL